MRTDAANSNDWQRIDAGPVGLLSDSHGDVARTRAGLELLMERRVKLILHCGDLGGEAVVDQLAGLPTRLVLGNVDPRSLERYAELLGLVSGSPSLRLEVAGRRIGVTHGHLTSELERLMSERPDFILHGHTHEKRDEIIDGIRFLNPGAVTPSPTSSVALLDPESGSFEWIDLPDP